MRVFHVKRYAVPEEGPRPDRGTGDPGMRPSLFTVRTPDLGGARSLALLAPLPHVHDPQSGRHTLSLKDAHRPCSREGTADAHARCVANPTLAKSTGRTPGAGKSALDRHHELASDGAQSWNFLAPCGKGGSTLRRVDSGDSHLSVDGVRGGQRPRPL